MLTSSMIDAARTIVEARREGRGFSGYPGDLPGSLSEAYSVQTEAISLWDKPIAGWKVGRISGDDEKEYGENRFVGPIFADTIWPISEGEFASFPVIPEGSAALEAELIARVQVPQRGVNSDWTARSVLQHVRNWHVGLEVAGSPLADIGELGPLVSIAAFGNNLGLFLGPKLPFAIEINSVECTANIGAEQTGPNRAAALPNGPLEAIAFALNKLSSLGRLAPTETLISTGAITGIHRVVVDQECRIVFQPGGILHCRTSFLPSAEFGA